MDFAPAWIKLQLSGAKIKHTETIRISSQLGLVLHYVPQTNHDIRYVDHIFDYMIFCVESQRLPFEFHTKYSTHRLKDV